jgi:ribonucleoside-diphosphate reductase alpha chain
MQKARKGVIEQKTWFVKDTGELFPYTLDYKKVIDTATESALKSAEPGILYWDRYIDTCFTQHTPALHPTGVNGCSEFSGTPYSACMLGSLNLANLLDDKFDFRHLETATRTAISALNKVLNKGFDRHPIPEMGEVARNERQIGLGIMGLADLFIKLGIKYGSQESIELSEKLAQTILNSAVLESAHWSRLYGSYKGYNYEEVSRTTMFQNLSQPAQDAIKEYGLYNSRLLAIAPSGSISTMLGISSGIEPVYQVEYKRRTQSLHNEDVYYSVYHQAVQDYMEKHNLEEKPSHVITANEVDYKDKIAIISAWQKYTDNAISNTLNLPKGTTFEKLQDVYFEAWEKGLKGLSIYVDGSLDSQVLVGADTTETKPPIKQEEVPEDTFYLKRTLKHGCGYMKVMIGWSPSQNKIIDMYGIPRSGAGCTLNITAQFVYISHILRTSNNLQEIKKAIEGLTPCPSFTNKAKTDKSLDGKNCATAILRMIKKFDAEMRGTPIPKGTDLSKIQVHNYTTTVETVNTESELLCKKCGKPIQFEDGCTDCPHCGTVNCS